MLLIYQRKNLIISILIILLLCIGLYGYRPVTLEEISSVEGLVRYAKSFGPVMPLAVMVTTVIQAIIPVIPFVILCSANGILFGLTKGVLLTWVGTLVGASLVFFLSRRMGYEWAVGRYKTTGLKNLGNMEGFRGFLVILALRLLPYMPAPLVNVSAGVSRISFFWFFMASAVGKLPFIIGYTLLGYSLLHSKNYTSLIAVMAAIVILPYLIVRRSKNRVSLKSKE